MYKDDQAPPEKSSPVAKAVLKKNSSKFNFNKTEDAVKTAALKRRLAKGGGPATKEVQDKIKGMNLGGDNKRIRIG